MQLDDIQPEGQANELLSNEEAKDSHQSIDSAFSHQLVEDDIN